MKHSIEELYKVHNCGHCFLATSEYIKAFNIPTDREAIKKAREMKLPYATCALYQQHQGDVVKVYHPYILGTIYMFGEKTWFDTQKELDEHRAKYYEQRQLTTERNKAKMQLMQYIENYMTTEQILDLLQELEG